MTEQFDLLSIIGLSICLISAELDALRGRWRTRWTIFVAFVAFDCAVVRLWWLL